MCPRTFAALLLLAGLGACSTRDLYQGGQSWQRQECMKLPDAAERARCQASTQRSYEDYRRESDAARSKVAAP